jgi:predicted RNase H-like HicB family nuclease
MEPAERGRKQMENLRVQLRMVFYKEAGFWIAHCLEMDVMGHARTRGDAFRRMNEAIALQITQSVKHDNRANIFMPADAKYFEMYNA